MQEQTHLTFPLLHPKFYPKNGKIVTKMGNYLWHIWQIIKSNIIGTKTTLKYRAVISWNEAAITTVLQKYELITLMTSMIWWYLRKNRE